MKKVHSSIITRYWSNVTDFFNYSHSERVVIKVMDRSLKSILDQVTIENLWAFHKVNSSLLSSFILGILKAFECKKKENYSRILKLSMSKVKCDYDIIKIDIRAKRAGEIYAECFIDEVTEHYSPATKYISMHIMKELNEFK